MPARVEGSTPLELDRRRVFAWLAKHPFDEPRPSEERRRFSFPDWLAEGRSLPNVMAVLLEEVRGADLLAEQLREHVKTASKSAFALGLLGERGDARIVQALLRATRAKDFHLRCAAIEALAWVGDHTVVASLEGVVADKAEDRQFRFRAADALGWLGARSSESVLRAATNDADEFLGIVAKGSLMMLDVDRPCIEAMIAADRARHSLKAQELEKALAAMSEPMSARATAAVFLGGMGNEASRELLGLMMRDPDPQLSGAARCGLRLLDWRRSSRLLDAASAWPSTRP